MTSDASMVKLEVAVSDSMEDKVFRVFAAAMFAHGEMSPRKNELLQSAASVLGIAGGRAMDIARAAQARPRSKANSAKLRQRYPRVIEFIVGSYGIDEATAPLIGGLRRLLAIDHDGHIDVLRKARHDPSVAVVATNAGLPEAAFSEFCARGETINACQGQGDHVTAAELCLDAIARQLALGCLDTFITGKAVLGLLLSYVFLEEYDLAHEVWVAHDNLFYVGINSVERGGLSVNDTILYLQLGAFLYSLSPDHEMGERGVNDHCQRVLEYCREEEPEWVPFSLFSWRAHLNQLYEHEIPEAASTALVAAEEAWGGPGSADGLRYFEPSPWVIDW